MSYAAPLPRRPGLKEYEALAKSLAIASRQAEPGAVLDWATRWAHVIARREGATDRSVSPGDIARAAKRIEQRWRECQKSNAQAARCLLSGARFFIASEHGFANWSRFARHLEALDGPGSLIRQFEAAADAIVTGNVRTLGTLLREHPELARARSTREHRSTLLHYVPANGVEDFRQKTPDNIVAIARVLLTAGADVNAESAAYGGGATALGLVATSVHPERAGLQIPLLQTLIDHGAKLDTRSAGNGHSAITGCLANGQPAAAEFLAARGAPLDLEGAAGLGRLSLVRSYLEDAGSRRKRFTPRQVESAFHYACFYGRKEVAEFLLQQGCDPGGRASGDHTPLHSAAFGAHPDIVSLLLRHGASVQVKDRRDRATPLDTAIYVWANSSDPAARERSYEVIALLARAGALLDPKQWEDPESGRSDVLDMIRSDARLQAALLGQFTS